MSRPPSVDPRERLRRSITERQWQQTVVEAAQWHGWWAWHDQDSRRNESGLPDLILIRPPRVLFVELKKETGATTAVQDLVLAMLGDCSGVETYLWRPSDEETMKRVLAR